MSYEERFVYRVNPAAMTLNEQKAELLRYLENKLLLTGLERLEVNRLLTLDDQYRLKLRGRPINLEATKPYSPEARNDQISKDLKALEKYIPTYDQISKDLKALEKYIPTYDQISKDLKALKLKRNPNL
jgi:transposase